MRNWGLTLILGFIVITHAGRSQVWIGSDDFQGNQINTNLWMTNVASIRNASVFVSNGLKYSSTSSITEENAYLTWANLLPKNENWTITANAFVNNSSTLASNQKIAVSLYLVSYFQSLGDSDYINNRKMFGVKLTSDSWGSEIIAVKTTNATVGNWSAYKSGYKPLNEATIALKYDAQNTTLSAWFNPLGLGEELSGMIKLTEMNIQDWNILNNSASYYAILGGQSESVQTTGMDAYSTKINVVPEPSALSLLAVGLGVLFRRNRKKD